jgi:aquaporin Z
VPGRYEHAAEAAGTFLLLAVGLSAVVVNFSDRSPVPEWLPEPWLRRLLTGAIFAGTATAIVYSRLGRRSGAHINPAVTLAFLRMGKLKMQGAVGYLGAQLGGAMAGAALVRLAWGDWAQEVRLGATTPGRAGPFAAFLAEVTMTALLVTLILHFVDRPRLMPWTGVAAGVLVVVLVVTLAPVSGTSLNPVRSLAPAVVSPFYDWFWLYLVGPPLGALLAVAFYRRSRPTVRCAKLFHPNEAQCHFLDCQYTKVALP